MKPMLAVEAPKDIKFPVFASAKIDGVRAVCKDSVLLSRSLKLIPNAFVQGLLGVPELHGLDGELTVGDANAKNVMQTTMSGVMTMTGEPQFTYWIFDFWTDVDMPYGERYAIMQRGTKAQALASRPYIQLLPQIIIHNDAELRAFEASMLEMGYEGVMIRDPKGVYKFGRSTAREGTLLKVKRFVDSEAVIIGYEELMHNANEKQIDNLGHSKRSSHSEGMMPMDTLGAIGVRDLTTGVTFYIGTGFDAAMRAEIWANRAAYLDRIVTYKHFAQVGVVDKPRMPVFKGFRDARDLS